MKNAPIYLLLLITVCNCSTIEDIDVGLDEPQLVLNSSFSPDNPWQVQLTRTVNIDDNPSYIAFYPTVGDAQVMLYDDQHILIEQLILDPLNFTQGYRGITKPEEGKRYHIEVNVANEPTRKSTNAVPYTVPILQVEQETSSLEGKINVVFDDPPGVENFYVIRILQDTYYTSNSDTVWMQSYRNFTPSDPAYENNYSYDDGVYFNDRLFDGKKVNFRLVMYSYSSFNTFKIHLELVSVSAEYYQYIVTTNLQRSTGDDPLAQPVIAYGNVENGLGIFAGFSKSSVIINK